MSAPTLPNPDADSLPFWDGCRAGYLSAQKCPSCERFRWPPSEFCPFCHHHGGDWTTLPGTGTIRSFVIVDRAFDPGFVDRVPYVVAHIALDGADGVNIISNVLIEPADAVAIGQRVMVEFVDTGTIALPQFRPV